MQAAKRTSFEENHLVRRTLPEKVDFGYHPGMDKERDELRPGAEAGEGAGDAAATGGERSLRHADIAAAQRKARAANTLRENLLRRKLQQRSRRQGQADETDGLPAVNSPNRDD
ncbi:MAG: hypothetical protein KJ670_11160 [Alphaproteobacteria bacterium]|nr:hypothetical protein [Rhizobiaceae bacterium]MBU3963996.1 hypothetical protein [Alphaproteobacteria bacterium]MBU4048192.1 hypothetical protein [Alphaproteobacteria bacterium]MBU4089263.1 hypothetical protein [Alphaproteobacteria bacterium]MBU4158737.1 hypothetical protein [Alphaproteobacteria bacterium]